jgi:microcystin-dependent protein
MLLRILQLFWRRRRRPNSLMPNTLPLIVQMGALPLNFQGTPQQFADAIAARLSVVTQQSLALFVSGTTEPSSDVGPWYNTQTEPGSWWGWDAVLGNYQPLPIPDVSLRYILSEAEPDPSIFQLWVKLSPVGKGIGVYTYYNGAWHDVYEDVIATQNTAIANVFKPFGVAGSVLTSNGPDSAPTWNTGLPIGTIIDFGGATAPSGFMTCDGSIKAIASYPVLFSVIGSLYGGDGLTTFAVPDRRGRSPRGIGTGDATGATPWSLGQKAGGETVVITQANLPSTPGATNRYTKASADGNVANPAGGLVSNPGSGSNSWQTDGLGSDSPLNIVDPSIGAHFCIRYQ